MLLYLNEKGKASAFPITMGKGAETAADTAELKLKKRKKKGRPPKASHLPSTPTKPISYVATPSSDRRSARRSHSLDNFNEFADENKDDRKEKKVKLVVRLPESNEEDIDQKQQNNRRRSRDYASGSGSDFDPNSDDEEWSDKKRKINTVDRGSNHADSMQGKKVSTVTETLDGSPMDSGPITPLPDRTTLIFILDRLQKKDIYGVFSEPVDPNELPDYGEMIEHPMDFRTVRKKLDGGAYESLEELETDIFLICSNAMTYNAPDTIYYRQARSIQELAKRDFENLKHEGDDGELQPKVVRRGRPPSKNQKKPVDTSPLDRVCPDPSSVALASAEEKIVGSNSYNLRKVPTPQRFRYTADPSNFRSRNGENNSEWLSDWSDFPATILRADMKYGNKQFTVDENRRDTYRQFNPLSLENKLPVLSKDFGDLKQLVPVGLHEPLAYGRSLAKYAANLGPVAWIIASKKIESVLPSGMQYGPGWVGEKVTPSQPLSPSSEKEKSLSNAASYFNSSKPAAPHSTHVVISAVECCASEAKLEAARKPNSQNELVVLGKNACSIITEFRTPENPMYQSHRNGFHGMFGYDLSAMTNPKLAIAVHPVMDPIQMVETESRKEPCSTHLSSTNHVILEAAKLTENRNTSPVVSQTAQGTIRQTVLIPPDLNDKVAAGSPNSSLQINSPQQPDLALQL